MKISESSFPESVGRLRARVPVAVGSSRTGAAALPEDDIGYLHVMEILAVLEGIAVALSSHLTTDEDLDIALGINKRMQQLLDPFEAIQFAELDRQLHAQLLVRCPYPDLVELVQHTWACATEFNREAWAMPLDRAHDCLDEHLQIIEHVLLRSSPSKIEDAVREHHARTIASHLGFRIRTDDSPHTECPAPPVERARGRSPRF